MYSNFSSGFREIRSFSKSLRPYNGLHEERQSLHFPIQWTLQTQMVHVVNAAAVVVANRVALPTVTHWAVPIVAGALCRETVGSSRLVG